MVTYRVSASFYLFKEFREEFNILAYAEKCSLGIILVKLVQYPRSDFRSWSIIKSKEDTLLFIRKIPDKSREKLFDDFGWSYLHFTLIGLAKIIIKINFAVYWKRLYATLFEYF